MSLLSLRPELPSWAVFTKVSRNRDFLGSSPLASSAGIMFTRERDIPPNPGRRRRLAMSIEENKAVVQRFFKELLSTDNFSVTDEILAPDFRFYFAGSPDPMDLQSYKEFLVMRRAAFPDRHFTVEEMVAEGDKVSARFTMRGTHEGEMRGIAPTGKTVTMTGIDIIRLREGKMVEDRVEVDQLGMMRQLGVILALGQPEEASPPT
jgi:predicted ester cyclase